MWLRKQIPNLFTLGNLVCGSLAIIFLFRHGENAAVEIAVLMGAGLLFDFADGFVARLLGVSSEMGKQLDSLSDMVSFGLLPGLLVYWMLGGYSGSATLNGQLLGFAPMGELGQWVPYVGLLIPVFSAYRLAKFNIDTRQTDKFMGMATPANAIFFVSLFMIWSLDGGKLVWHSSFQDYLPSSWTGMVNDGFWLCLVHPWVVVALTLIFSILLVVDIPLIALKFKKASWKGNEARYLLLLSIVALLLIFSYRGVPLCILVYFILSGLDHWFFSRQKA